MTTTDIGAPSTEKVLARGEQIRAFIVSLIAVTLSTADQSLFSYAIPELTREFDVELGVIGTILSISFFVASFTVVIAGVLSDSIGRRKILVLLLALSALFVGAHALATSLFSLTLLRVAGFALGAGLYPIANTIVVETAPARYRGLFAGFLQVGYPLGFALAALIVSPLIETYGWRAIFYPAFLIVIIAPLLGRLLPESPRFQQDRAERLRQAGREHPLKRLRELWEPGLRARALVCFVGSFLISLAIGGTTYFLPTYLVEAHGMTISQAGVIAGSSYAIGAIGYLAASTVGEFLLTRRNTLIIWLWLGALAFAATIWLAVDSLVIMLGLGLTILFVYGSEAVRMPMIGELFPTRVRATATSMAGSLAVTTAWLVAPMLISFGAENLGWEKTLTFFAVFPLIIGGAAFTLLVNLPSGLRIEETAQV